MRAAAIDIGSNTVRLLIADHDGRQLLKPLVHQREITRMARGIDISGMLDPAGARQTHEVVVNFLSMAQDHGVSDERLLVAGASALREASDSGSFISDIQAATGAHVRVLTPDEEGRATALGVLRVYPETQSALVLDIGGGSTEAVRVIKGNVRSSFSVPVGVVKLIERHLSNDPPGEAELEGLVSACEEVAGNIKQGLGADAVGKIKHGLGADAAGSPEFIATAGTATTAASIDMALNVYDRGRVEGYVIKREVLEAMFVRLAGMPLETRSLVKGLEEGREDLIIPGLALTIGIMDAYGFAYMKVSDSGLLEGLCLIAMGEGGQILK